MMNKDEEKIVDTLLKAAKNEKKSDWNVYSFYKRQIDELLLNTNEYEEVIRKLCNVLEL